MQEARRQAYLHVLGVTSWVPRQPLSGAAKGRRPLHATVESPQSLPVATAMEKPAEVAPQPTSGADAVRQAMLPARQPTPAASAAAEQSGSSTAMQPARQSAATVCPPFTAQLWLAGPCALLLEMPADGLGARSPAARLLADILRAVQLPMPAQFLADFKWPLTRNTQFEQSEVAAHQALQAFVQARLEQQTLVSLGSFGRHAGLLAKASVVDAEAAFGREEALEGLPPAWFAPSLDDLLQTPASKAELWALLQRVMVRWQSA
ncbi:hypothetical protein [Halopseudomonas salegens]|uniref:Energy transducer TonB n=1 Tax=Halopseudomonas salegens TaxID=1434072 RepID=A0A1H2GNK0_9GAMM|nr:hypothetical protein [Halopseudomonas salegens]SDU21062.1 hypothetical protein SAMN05216210_2431 [Halopseudomonas salegens]